ncbi:MAG: hypothetical protein VCC00_13955 [Deltaproteobacteria bacterium]
MSDAQSRTLGYGYPRRIPARLPAGAGKTVEGYFFFVQRLTFAAECGLRSAVPASIDIPAELLQLMDAKAKSRGLSRDRFIVEVLRRTCGTEGAPATRPELSSLNRAAEARQSVEDLAAALRRRHRASLHPS